MPEVALQTLDLVGRELNNTLGEARTALETFVEQPENVVLPVSYTHLTLPTILRV